MEQCLKKWTVPNSMFSRNMKLDIKWAVPISMRYLRDEIGSKRE